MFKVTRYFVENGQGPASGPFRERAEARAVAASAARRGQGAKVYAVIGEPMFDLWREPVLIEAYSAGSVAAETEAPAPKTAQIIAFIRRSRTP